LTRPFVIIEGHIKWTIIMDGGNQCFKKHSLKIPHSVMCQILINQRKVTSTWHHHVSWKLVALKLHSSCSYMIVTKLHELHMYMVSYMVSCIRCNSCNLSNSTHAHRNMLNHNELQMIIVTQKPNYKVSFKSPHFLIMCKLLKNFLTINYL
jgi:hypothetical protein